MAMNPAAARASKAHTRKKNHKATGHADWALAGACQRHGVGELTGLFEITKGR